MRKLIIIAVAAIFFAACNNEKKEETNTEKSASTVSLPYTAGYSSQFNDKVSDSSVLTVLNSYKFWENADMNGLATTLGDSLYFVGWDGFKLNGTKSDIMKLWTSHRDSMSKVEITMDAWTKDHSVDKNDDFVLVWYKEIDTYKTGKVDSANYADINQLKNGKIYWYSQYRQELKKK
jgi:hypothetical protein